MALPEPLIDTVLVGVPCLRDCGNGRSPPSGCRRSPPATARLAIGLDCNPLVADAHVAGLLLLAHGDELHAVPRADVALTANECLDPRAGCSRRLDALGRRRAHGAAGRALSRRRARPRRARDAAQALGSRSA